MSDPKIIHINPIDELLKAIAIVKSYRWETQYINGTALSPQDTETKETVDGSP